MSNRGGQTKRLKVPGTNNKPNVLFKPGQVGVNSHRLRTGMADGVHATVQTGGGLDIHQHGGMHIIDKLAVGFAQNPELLKITSTKEAPDLVKQLAFATFDAIQDEFALRNAKAQADAEAKEKDDKDESAE